VVELEVDLVLVTVEITGTQPLRAKTTWKLVRGGQDAGDPYFELLLASLLHSP
jgi:hypothetical protein